MRGGLCLLLLVGLRKLALLTAVGIFTFGQMLQLVVLLPLATFCAAFEAQLVTPDLVAGLHRQGHRAFGVVLAAFLGRLMAGRSDGDPCLRRIPSAGGHRPRPDRRHDRRWVSLRDVSCDSFQVSP